MSTIWIEEVRQMKLLKCRELDLPDLNMNENTEVAFTRAFIGASRALEQQLKQIQLVLEKTQDFLPVQVYSTIYGLFAKIRRHYSSYVWLEVERDVLGSQLLLEQFYAAAITLIYLLEEDLDESLFWQYCAASIRQAHALMSEVKAQLQQLPVHRGTLKLHAQLEKFLADRASLITNLPGVDDRAYSWGVNSADTTAKRATLLGLQALNNPARQLTLRVTPASLLQLQLLPLPSDPQNRGSSQLAAGIDFTCWRDASHLCLHAAQTVLEVVVDRYVPRRDRRLQQQRMNTLYEWFHSAHHAYQRQCAIDSSY